MTMSQSLVSKHRLEALADGVFAIAMTILVLEVKVPEIAERRSIEALGRALGHAWPTLLAYFFSFFMLGLFWFWHHRLTAKLRRIDGSILVLNLLFLALISFFPFAAALVGRYLTNPLALMVYLPVMGLILTTQAVTLEVALRHHLVDPEIPAREILQARLRNIMGCAIFSFAAIPAALLLGWGSAVTCGICGGGFLLFARFVRRAQRVGEPRS